MYAKSFMEIVFHVHNEPLRVGLILISILQMWKPKHREAN